MGQFEVSDVRIRKVEQRADSDLVAYASIRISDAIVIHNIRVLEGRDGLYIQMPQRRTKDRENGKDKWVDVVHPANDSARTEIIDKITEEYRRS